MPANCYRHATCRSNSHSSSTLSWWKDIALLTLFLFGLFSILLGVAPLFVPDEGRYAEIAREMVASGDYITPTLNQIIYFEKPILFYWLEAAAIKVGGLNLWSLRSINAALALLCCLLTYYTVRKLYDRLTALLAAIILSTSTLFFVMAHIISLDLPVTSFMALSLYAFLLGYKAQTKKIKHLYFWTAASSAALAVLTKGLIGLIFPMMIVGTWIIIMNEWRIFKTLPLLSCLLIFLLIAMPWHVLVDHRHPEFFSFYFIEQHFLRYTTKEVGHYQPIWFFIPYLIIGFFPWIVFLPQACKRAIWITTWNKREKHSLEVFFFLWALLIFIFFSFSKSKLIPYILPIFPPLSILTARYLREVWNKKTSFTLYLSYACLLVLTIVITSTYYFFPLSTSLAQPKIAALYLNIASGFLILGCVLSCYYLCKNIKKAFFITSTMTYLFLISSLAAVPAIDTRTILPLANILKLQMRPNDELISFNQYNQDLPFYLERRVTILNWQNELTFGMHHQDTHEWMIDDLAFWRRWESKKRVFVIMNKHEYQHHCCIQGTKHYILGETVNNILFSNRQN